MKRFQRYACLYGINRMCHVKFLMDSDEKLCTVARFILIISILDNIVCRNIIFVVRSGQVTASRVGMTLLQSVMTQTPGRRLPAQRAGHPGLTHPVPVTRGGLMNFDVDLNHTQWQPICINDPKKPTY